MVGYSPWGRRESDTTEQHGKETLPPQSVLYNKKAKPLESLNYLSSVTHFTKLLVTIYFDANHRNTSCTNNFTKLVKGIP